jgi:uncharacterized protein DUF3467
MQPKEPRGEYANYLEVGHNAYEFVLHFGQAYEGDREPQVNTRIVTNPVCAKAFLETLQTSVRHFESEHGAVRDRPEARNEPGK